MRVDALTVDFWRNDPHAALSFAPGVNVFYGENAQGKTNLLEAIAYLSSARRPAHLPGPLPSMTAVTP